MQHSDTNPEAVRIQAEIYRRMTGEQRLKIAMEICELTRELAMTRIRLEHPDWNERQVRVELVRLAFLPHELPPGVR